MFVTGICFHFARKVLRIQFRSGIAYSGIRVFYPIAVREGSAGLQIRVNAVQIANRAAGNGKAYIPPFYFLHASRRNPAAALRKLQFSNTCSFYAYSYISLRHAEHSCNLDVLLEHRCFFPSNIDTFAPQFPAIL